MYHVNHLFFQNMIRKYKTVDFFDYSVFCDSLKNIEITDHRNVVFSTINPHSYIIAKKDAIYKKALLTTDFLLPDGIGIVYAIKYLHKIQIIRITGYDLMVFLLERLNKTNGKCFFVGSTNMVLKSITNRIGNEYSNVKVGFYSPPFRSIFSNYDNAAIIDAINNFKPDILFIGMTAPKQEKWVYQNKENLNVDAICSVGAAFDFYAETVKRPSQFWRDMGFEWLSRFLKNPIRLWKRIFISMPLFILDILKLKIKIKL